ncbi:YihY/virulence factor BrkB family protein [Hymenobacter cellulosivorans]|uniref:YihY/virulence factor BrkB family protein n=1 Tax=Hymenobacter cellulosivorans TaxID=2932249 RepID=A0ABY4F6Z6_9BACT|nr:YihY/virulence factor BrkB family protein [Hymenobacter cellulosivorans]UOQ51991.1 YihY/virulence factor BrkB family protein [Hymenobacter cellulosivorans]
MTKVRQPGQPRRKVWTDFFLLLRRAAKEFALNDPLRLGAATAFFTTFALPPILIILIQVLGSVYSTSGVRQRLLDKLSALLGTSAAELVEQILLNVGNIERSRLLTWLGFGFLLFIATTLFVVIQNSLNQLWQVRSNRTTGRFSKMLKERTRSLGLLLTTGLLSLVAFGSDAGLAFFADYIRDFDPNFGYFVVQALNQLVSLLILAVWFGVTFRNLSYAHVPWKAVLRGALVTAVLIDLGEFALGHLLVPRNLGPIYGHASSIVLVLLFVFYSAMIFYFGACFTKVYAHYVGLDIRPKKNAVRYRLVDLPDEPRHRGASGSW